MKSVKRLFLGAALLIAASVSAQQGQRVALACKDIPAEAQQLNMAERLVAYGRQTKTAMPIIQALQIYRQLNVTVDSSAVEYSDGLVAEATRYADNNENLLRLLSDVQQATRDGAVDGPKRFYISIPKDGGMVYRKTWLVRGRHAQIVLAGEGKTDLSMDVFTDDDQLVEQDYSLGNYCVAAFIPTISAEFTIVVSNNGSNDSHAVLYVYNQ